MPYRASAGHFDGMTVLGPHWSPMLRKSPYSLPASQYGGGRKRIFIGLMLASCCVACLALAGALGEHCPPACLEELGFLPSGMGRRVRAVGNSSLDGAALLAAEPWRLPALARWCATATLVPVAEDPGFHADYLRHMRFGV